MAAGKLGRFAFFFLVIRLVTGATTELSTLVTEDDFGSTMVSEDSFIFSTTESVITENGTEGLSHNLVVDVLPEGPTTPNDLLNVLIGTTDLNIETSTMAIGENVTWLTDPSVIVFEDDFNITAINDSSSFNGTILPDETVIEQIPETLPVPHPQVAFPMGGMTSPVEGSDQGIHDPQVAQTLHPSTSFNKDGKQSIAFVSMPKPQAKPVSVHPGVISAKPEMKIDVKPVPVKVPVFVPSFEKIPVQKPVHFPVKPLPAPKPVEKPAIVPQKEIVKVAVISKPALPALKDTKQLAMPMPKPVPIPVKTPVIPPKVILKPLPKPEIKFPVVPKFKPTPVKLPEIKPLPKPAKSEIVKMVVVNKPQVQAPKPVHQIPPVKPIFPVKETKPMLPKPVMKFPALPKAPTLPQKEIVKIAMVNKPAPAVLSKPVVFTKPEIKPILPVHNFKPLPKPEIKPIVLPPLPKPELKPIVLPTLPKPAPMKPVDLPQKEIVKIVAVSKPAPAVHTKPQVISKPEIKPVFDFKPLPKPEFKPIVLPALPKPAPMKPVFDFKPLPKPELKPIVFPTLPKPAPMMKPVSPPQKEMIKIVAVSKPNTMVQDKPMTFSKPEIKPIHTMPVVKPVLLPKPLPVHQPVPMEPVEENKTVSVTVLSNIGDAFHGTFDGTKLLFSKAQNAVKEATESMWNKTNSLIAAFQKSLVQPVVSGPHHLFSNVKDAGESAGKTVVAVVVSPISNGTSKFVHGAKEAIQPVANGVHTAPDKASKVIFVPVGNSVNTFGEKMKASFEEKKRFFQELLENKTRDVMDKIRMKNEMIINNMANMAVKTKFVSHSHLPVMKHHGFALQHAGHDAFLKDHGSKFSGTDASRKCDINEVYMECGSSCTRTCMTLNKPIVCSMECKPGCYCREGLLYSSIKKKCVTHAKCKFFRR